jgi:hypothetical protein
MRRLLSALVVLGTTAAIWTIPASAGTSSIKLHSDPNDTSSVLDIRKVGTDQDRRHVFTAVRSWDPFNSSNVTLQNDSFWVFFLDTKGRGKADRRIFLGYDSDEGRFECDVFIVGGGFKGDRAASTQSDSIACVTPKKWYGIEKPVRIGVEAYDNNNFVDRAPNDGRYVGL